MSANERRLGLDERAEPVGSVEQRWSNSDHDDDFEEVTVVNLSKARWTPCSYIMAMVVALLFLVVGAIGWYGGETLVLVMQGDMRGVNQLINAVKDLVEYDCSGAWKPSFDPDSTIGWPALLRKEWETIRGELYDWEREGHYIPSFPQIDRRQQSLDSMTPGTWSTLWLRLYGQDTEASVKFPKTMALLGKTTASTAMFSILEPGKGIAIHRGEVKAVLRYHLALEVPPPSIGKTDASEPLALNVATKMFYTTNKDGTKEERAFIQHPWTEGGDFLFDDTFLHFVENERKRRCVCLSEQHGFRLVL
jgi:hypothetical protein